MELRTRFGLGEKVVSGYVRWELRTCACETCGGKGRLGVARCDGSLLPETLACPMCGNSGRRPTGVDVFVDTRELTVGLVRASATGAGRTGPTMQEEYMCLETGVGSGSVYRLNDPMMGSDNLFASAEEANSALAGEMEETRMRLTHLHVRPGKRVDLARLRQLTGDLDRKEDS